jgi:hypothetical protein
MKSLLKIPLCVASLMLLSAPLQGATIVASEVWFSYADGGYPETTEPFMPEGLHPEEESSMTGWKGISGGQMTIRLDVGETVLSAKLIGTGQPITGGTYAPVTWDMVLWGGYPSAGHQAGDQVWYSQQQHFANFTGTVDWKSEIQLWFEVETTQGSYRDDNGGANYLIHYGTIPEASTASLGLVGLLVAFRRRRR